PIPRQPEPRSDVQPIVQRRNPDDAPRRFARRAPKCRQLNFFFSSSRLEDRAVEWHPGTLPQPVMLTVQDLRLRYHTEQGEVEAVRGLSLSVERVEFYTLLGPSGCGKTTTLRCIAGLETPDSGLIQ